LGLLKAAGLRPESSEQAELGRPEMLKILSIGRSAEKVGGADGKFPCRLRRPMFRRYG
jgi:hypothetical protein